MVKRTSLILTTAFFALLAGGQNVLSQEPFFKGKNIRIVVGTSAGGGFDAYTRTLARYLGKYIPGNPSIAVENMPGAGHLIGANHMYKVAKPDGLTIGHFQGGLFLHQLFGRPGIEFDARKFEFVGAPVIDNRACAFTKASGITSVESWQASKSPVKLGGLGGAAPDDIARMLAATTPLPIQLVAGYKGTAEIRLAAESGELAGGCWSWESMRATWKQGLDAGEVIPVVQVVAKPLADIPNVPLAINLAKTEDAKKLILVGVQNSSAFARPFAMAPGTPKDRVEIWRKAFQETMKDNDLLADAKKARLDIEPVSGQEMEKMVAALFKLNPGLIAKLKEILGAS